MNPRAKISEFSFLAKPGTENLLPGSLYFCQALQKVSQIVKPWPEREMFQPTDIMVVVSVPMLDRPVFLKKLRCFDFIWKVASGVYTSGVVAVGSGLV